MNTTTRALRALTLVFAIVGAVVASTAAPASASTHTFSVTRGPLVVTQSSGSGAQTINLASIAGSCPVRGGVVDLTATAADISTFGDPPAPAQRVQLTFSGGTYIAAISRLYTVPGTVTGSSPASIDDLVLALNFDIYQPSPSCSLGTQVCDDLQFEMTLDGTFSGNPAAPSPGDVVLLHGSDTIALTTASFCNAPFASYINGHATFLSSVPLELTLA